MVFSFSDWVNNLFKGVGHKYIKRIPYNTPKGRRYRYVYRVTNTHRGRHAFDEEHLTTGAKFALNTEDGAEFHGHITAVDGDKITYTIDDGPRKGEEVTTTREELVAELHDLHDVQDKLSAARDKVRERIAEAKRAGHEGVVRRLETRLAALGGGEEAPKQEQAGQQGADNFETMPEVEADTPTQADEPAPDFESTLLQRDAPAKPAPKGAPWLSEGAKNVHARLKALADDPALLRDFNSHLREKGFARELDLEDAEGILFGVSRDPALGAAALAEQELRRGIKGKNGTAYPLDFSETGNKGYKIAWIREKKRAGLGVLLTEGPFAGNHYIFKPMSDKTAALAEMTILLRRMREAGMTSGGDLPLDYLEDATDPRGFNVLNNQLAEIAEVFRLDDLLFMESSDDIPRDEREELVDKYGEDFVARVESRLAKLSDDTQYMAQDLNEGVIQAKIVADHYDDFLAESERAQAAQDKQDELDRQYAEQQRQEYAQRTQAAQDKEDERAQRREQREERESRVATDRGPAFVNDQDLISHEDARDEYLSALVPNAQSLKESAKELRGESVNAIIAAAKAPLVVGGKTVYTLPGGLGVTAELDEASRVLKYQIQFSDGEVSNVERVQLSGESLSAAKLKTLARGLVGSVYGGSDTGGNVQYYTLTNESDLRQNAQRLARFKKLEDRERDFETFSEMTEDPRVQRDQLDAITPREDALESAADIDRKTAAILKKVIDPKQTTRNLDEAFRVGDALIATDGHRIFVRSGMSYGDDGKQVSTGAGSVGGISVSTASFIPNFLSDARQQQTHVGTMSKETAAHVVAALKVGGAKIKKVEQESEAGKVMIRADGETITIKVNGRDVATFPQSSDGAQGDYRISARYLSDALSGGGAVSLHLPPVKFAPNGRRLYTPLRFDSMLGSMHVQPVSMD